MTASPAKLVSMLYDRVIISLREAISAIEAGEVEARCLEIIPSFRFYFTRNEQYRVAFLLYKR